MQRHPHHISTKGLLPLLVFVYLCSLFAPSCTGPSTTEQTGKEPTQKEAIQKETVQQEPTKEATQEPTVSEPTKEPTQEPTASEPTKEPSLEPQPKDAGTPETQAEATQEIVAEQAPESTPQEGGTKTFSAKVTDADDAVASYLIGFSSWNYLGGATVPVGRHFNNGNPSYHTAFRFKNVTIPQGATIISAYLSVYPTNEIDSNNRLIINIYAEKADNSVAYNPKDYTKNRPDQCLKTTAKINKWVVRCRADCSSDSTSPKYEYDCPQRKRDCWDRTVSYKVPKDLKALIQEVVSQPGWASGQAISLFLINAASNTDGDKYKDSRSVVGYDASKADKAPQLVVEYK